MPSRHADDCNPVAPARGRRVFAGTALSARAAWYRPNLRMQRHAHECHQVSLLLAGTLGEQGRREEVRLDVPAVGIKPAGVEHANDYGPAGALILGIDLPAGFNLSRELGLPARWQWRARPSPALLGLARSLLPELVAGAATADTVETRLWELLAAMAGCGQAPSGRPPAWVVRACERLHEAPMPLAALAAEEGLHPVYFARAFARWVGCAPSTFRARAQLQHALAGVAAGQSLAMAACHAGFADQAHFSRVARQHGGLSPARLRRLLG